MSHHHPDPDVPCICEACDLWSRDPDTLERIFHHALKQGDSKGVEAALTLMSGCDPQGMVRLAGELRDALVVARFLKGETPEAP